MIPAPVYFESLHDHLEKNGVDISTLKEAISSYLDLPNNTVITEFDDEPDNDLQAFYYLTMLTDFLASIS
ncbi:MAG: hypothetical protein MUF12_06845 [Sediminibacterium sp.]|jgi:hypothetical protein|nr:hypothetical protein [Sediminibacterium sp.]